MKATLIHEFGPPDVFRYEDVPTPKSAPDHVVVKVAACGLNRYDLYLRMGGIRKDVPLPHVMGADIAGTIAELGREVTGFTTGQRVIVAPGFPVNPEDWDHQPINQAPSYTVTGTLLWGGYAEYVQVPARFVIPDTTDVPQDQLATVPLCLVTAMHAVKTLGRVTQGTRVLIQAGASGSGSMCIQVAKVLGADVITTVGSEPKVETASSCGADRVIRRDKEEQVECVRKWTDGKGVDVVIDNVGAAVFDANTRSLRVGGILVNFGLVSGYKTDFNLRNFFFNQHTFKGSMMGTMAELHEGLDLLKAGRIKPVLDRTFGLKDAAAAHDYIESRAVRGSVALIP
ncbi:MAG: zinc-binding dehydrogenase [Phycisphaerae bacterium]